MRHKSNVVRIGNVMIGGEHPIAVQSMCNTLTTDVSSTLKQINELIDAKCEIVRLAVPDEKSVEALKKIRTETDVPLVADIHFDSKLTIQSIPHCDKIRINPGNIGSLDKVKEIINCAKNYSIPIRIGVNSGSVENEFRNLPVEEGLSKSCLKYIDFFKKNDFHNIVLSLKASDVKSMIASNRLIATECNYPIHLGVTESGTIFSGTIKSSIGIGSLLNDGIGDTIRVSLTANPVEEVKIGYEILKALKLRKGAEIISCPTCARQQIDVITLAKNVEERLPYLKKPLKIAVMGCVVNGPGEAMHADIGITAEGNTGIIFKNGAILKKVPKAEIYDELLKQIEELDKD